MKRSYTALLALLLALACAKVASAGPPYQTDDPEPTPPHQYEIYLFGDTFVSGGRVDADPFALEVNYGPAKDLQVAIDIPTSYRRDDGTSAYAFGDLDAGIKYRFVHESATAPQVAIYPSVTIASARSGAGIGHGTFFVPLWAQKTIGKWTVFGGGGVLFDRDAPSGHAWQGGVAFTRDVSQRTTLGIELFSRGRDADDPASTDVGAGWVYNVDTVHSLLFSAGASLNVPGAYHAYGAYEWRLGAKPN